MRWKFVNAIFSTIAAWPSSVLLYIESITIIPLIEFFVRIWYHLDPRVYSERMRIKGVVEGQVERKSDRYVILVLYAKGPLPKFTSNLIDAIDRSPLNLVVVSNAELDPALQSYLLGKCHLLIDRVNLGRDFGAYRDGINIILRRIRNIERLVLLNDSLFYFENGLKNLINRLNGDQEFIGLTEVFEFHYHVQSFAVSFGPNVVKHKKFLDFWRKYRPISSRRWSIHKGEVSLTRQITKAGFRPHIVFQAAELVAALGDRPIREILESLTLLPTFFRTKLYAEFDDILGGDGNAESIAAIEAISQGIRNFQSGRGSQLNQSVLMQINEQAENMQRWSFQIFTNMIVSTIAKHNQIHVGGFYFMKYLGLPAIKRDIFYREVYALEDIHRILTVLNEPLRDEVMADLRRAGTSIHLSPFWRLLYRHGSI
jgi:rhamnan synthesis protein F